MNKQDAAKILGLNGELTPKIIKTAFRKLSFKFHPDRNKAGLEMMKCINLAYAVLKDFEGSIDTETESSSEAFSDEISEALNAVISLEGLDIELCGTWIWIAGDTKQHKEALKTANYRWASKKEKWYWSPLGQKRSKGRGKFSMDQIRDCHGSRAIKGKSVKRVAA